ncbi:MAG: hypothetical protein IJT47_04750 [Selenomonadaceae bacterium]|nr:hypothetical protein [Selenomonadaceae bacterium]
MIIGIFSAAREQKLEHITLNQICRALSGDSGRARDMTALKNQITNSIRKLRSLEITVDATEAYQKLGYKMDKATLTDVLLPCAIVKFIKINGQNTTAFKIHDESPLMKVAEAKKQIARISKEAWNVPLNHTLRAIKIECELLYAVQTIVRAKKIKPNILLSRLYAAAGLSDLTDGMDNNQCVQIFKARQKVRTTIETILNHWKGQGMFAQWYFTMVNSQGRVVRHRGKNKVHGISIISQEP